MFLKTILVSTILSIATLPALSKATYSGIDVKSGKGIDANEVKVEGFIGGLVVTNLDANQVIIDANGDEEYLKNLVIEEDGGKLKISFKEGTAFTAKDSSKGTVNIRMPRAMPLDVSISSGNATIDDRQAPTGFHILGAGAIKAQGVDGPLNSQILGTGSIELTKLLGNANCEISGSGSIRIWDGKCDDFTASVKGAGHLSFGGEVMKNANLEVFGAGKIQLAKVTGATKQNSQGAGEIKLNEAVTPS